MEKYRFFNKCGRNDYTLKNSQAASLNGSAVGRNRLLNLVKLLDDGCGSGLDAVKATHQQLVRLLGGKMTWAVTSVILFVTKTFNFHYNKITLSNFKFMHIIICKSYENLKLLSRCSRMLLMSSENSNRSRI